MKKYKLLIFNDIQEYFQDHLAWVGYGFEVLTNPKQISMADVVIFHIPSLQFENEELKRLFKKEGQLWVFFSMEPEEYYKRFHLPEIIKLFDIIATYHFDSDIPLPYFMGIDENVWKTKPIKKTNFINAFISNPYAHSGRIECLCELMSFVEVHSYGKVLNNKQIDVDLGAFSKEHLIAQYKFTIAFENSIVRDYVTEKYFQPLLLGSVPIYLGAPNIEDFTPGKNCHVNFNAFDSIKELAEFLIYLDSHEEEYNKYLAWKNMPFHKTFSEKINATREHPISRLHGLVHKKLADDWY
jgi:hypothetical protein